MLTAKDGFFFLGRKDHEEYTARFRFTDAHIHHFANVDLDYDNLDDVENQANNLSAIVLKKWVKKQDI